MPPTPSMYNEYQEFRISRSEGAHAGDASTWNSPPKPQCGQADKHTCYCPQTTSNKTPGEQSAAYDPDIRNCPGVLRAAIKACPESEFRGLACVISLVENSNQQLNVEALSEAVQTYMTHPNVNWVLERDVPRFERWLRKFNSLIFVTDSGRVCFTESDMSVFLQNFPIRGIDASPRTLATLCVAQNHKDTVESLDRSSHGRTMSAFSWFAQNYGGFYEQIARQSCMSLSLDAFGRVDIKSSHQTGEPTSSKLAFRSRNQQKLRDPATSPTAEQIEQDWVFVKIPSGDCSWDGD